jgi:hypothetical protein
MTYHFDSLDDIKDGLLRKKVDCLFRIGEIDLCNDETYFSKGKEYVVVARDGITVVTES